MPTSVRVMAWNIQNFGSNTASYKAVKGANSSLLAPFIAAVVANYQVEHPGDHGGP